MDAVADLLAEHVVHEPVLGDPAKALKRLGSYHGVEVVAVAGDRRAGARNRGLNAMPKLFGGRRHGLLG